MSSDEDFSLVLQPSEETLEGLKALIKNQKVVYEQLLEDQTELESHIKETQKLTQQFRDRTQALKQDLQEDKERNMEQVSQDQERLMLLQQDEAELKQELERVMRELQKEEETNQKLRAQADVFSGAPEKKVVFKGHTGRVQDGPQFDMTPQILYPLEGGTALITFEEAVVAKKIVTMRRHRVDLEEPFYITVEARPVPITMPTTVEIDAEVCPRRILISDLPQMDRETLEDKLDIHFSKRKHGGGEVEQCEVLPESGNAVLTFVDNNIAKGLTDQEYHVVMLPDGKHRVRVTPFVNGKITNLETRTKLCSRTVLLTGIPDIADPETIQDLLEIHFQKSANGGGEIKAFVYSPEGQSRTAVFQTPPSNDKEDE